MAHPAPTVFLIEDDADMRHSLQWLLESHGLLVESYGDPAVFLTRYDKHRPGCLVIDLRLPGMSGLELRRKLAAEGGTHPFVFISAHGTFESALEALREGAVDFLAKPFDHALLVDRVRTAIQRDASSRMLQQEREKIQRRLDTLSPREREILADVVQGRLSKEIATKLGIKQKTVEVHRSNMVRKMKADSVAQLVRMIAILNEPADLIQDSRVS